MPQSGTPGGCLLLQRKQCFEDQELAITSAVSLCRTFCRLMAKGRMVKRKTNTMSKPEVTIIQWLKERYKDYVKELGKLIGNEESSVQVSDCSVAREVELG